MPLPQKKFEKQSTEVLINFHSLFVLLHFAYRHSTFQQTTFPHLLFGWQTIFVYFFSSILNINRLGNLYSECSTRCFFLLLPGGFSGELQIEPSIYPHVSLFQVSQFFSVLVFLRSTSPLPFRWILHINVKN